MSDSMKLLLIVGMFAVAADTCRLYCKWREGEPEPDEAGELRPVSTFRVAFGIAFVVILLCVYLGACSCTSNAE